MNVTVQPHIDDAVLEIVERQRGRCQAGSHHGESCSVAAAAIIHGSCPPEGSFLSCANFAGWVLRSTELRRGVCVDCGRRLPDCWSVVMLP